MSIGYIPDYYDGDVQAGFVAVCAILGVAAVLRGRQKGLPFPRLKRRVAIAVGCAGAGIVLYGLYVLQRQTVEHATHLTSGVSRQTPPTR